MRFDRKYNITAVAGRDVTRSNINCVHLETEKKRMYATDGHCIAFVPCEIEPSDKSGALSIESVSRARQSKTPEIRARKKLADVNKTALFRRPTANPLPVENALPKYKFGDKGTASITLNPELLYNVAKAMGRIGWGGLGLVTLTFSATDPLEPILVDYEGEEAFGVVMPGRRR